MSLPKQDQAIAASSDQIIQGNSDPNVNEKSSMVNPHLKD